MNQLFKMGLAVLFGFTLTLANVGCDNAGTEPAPAPAPAGDAPTDGSAAP